MRPLVLLKWSFLLGSLGAALPLAPPCKAQEITADQFDQPNTEPFEKPRTSPAATEANKTNHKARSKQAAVATKGQPRKSGRNQFAQLLSASDLSQTAGRDAVAIRPEPKTAPRKPKDE